MGLANGLENLKNRRPGPGRELQIHEPIVMLLDSDVYNWCAGRPSVCRGTHRILFRHTNFGVGWGAQFVCLCRNAPTLVGVPVPAHRPLTDGPLKLKEERAIYYAT